MTLVIAAVAMLVGDGRHVASAEEPCRISAAEQSSFMPRTTALQNHRPLARPDEALLDDCGLYKRAWEAFLYATQASERRPQFVALPTCEDVFKAKDSSLFANQQPGLLSLAPRRSKVGNKDETAHFGSDDLLQAGPHKVPIDAKGNAVWDAVHLNRTYQSFVKDYNLNDRKALDHLPADLAFGLGSLDLKYAWRIIAGPAPKNYITTKALIPRFKTTANGDIVRDGDKTGIVTVALLGLHVVGTIEGHPEFIWSTFEHVGHEQNAWIRDVAPTAKADPAASASVLVDGRVHAYALYPIDKARPQAPPVSTVNNDAVTSLNSEVQKLFEARAPWSVRSNYQLVGAIWLNTPEQDFRAWVNFLGAAKTPRKRPLSGGEDRLSSMTMESFTQSSDMLPNCFSCHNTEGVSGLPLVGST